MQYKTIALEMIQERPQWHEELRSSNSLLSTVNQYAQTLREIHLAAIEQLRQARPEPSPLQLSSEAMEMALKQLEQSLPTEPQSDAKVFSLDAAMQYIKRHTPRN
jgi:hypothetical protein